MADVIYTNAYLQPDIKSTLFWIFLVLSDSYMWMFLSFQWNVFSELCHRRNAIGGFHESKYKCFQMTMSCLQKRKKVKGCRNPFTPAVKKGKRIWSRVHSCLYPAATRNPSVQTGHKYKPYEPRKSPPVHYAFASERYAQFKVNIWNPHCQKRGCSVFEKRGGLVKGGFEGSLMTYSCQSRVPGRP